MNLTELQEDLLKEAFNLGVGQAACSLSELAGGEEIALSVPAVEVKPLHDLVEQVRETSGNEICGVSESFRGAFSGQAIMLYSQAESLELVKIMLGQAIPVEELSEMEGEALCEVGNIVLNACISTLANLLDTEIETEVPNMRVGECAEVLGESFTDDGDRHILYLKMTFHMTRRHLNGHIGFILDLATTKILSELLEQYFLRMMNSNP